MFWSVASHRDSKFRKCAQTDQSAKSVAETDGERLGSRWKVLNNDDLAELYHNENSMLTASMTDQHRIAPRVCFSSL